MQVADMLAKLYEKFDKMQDHFPDVYNRETVGGGDASKC